MKSGPALFAFLLSIVMLHGHDAHRPDGQQHFAVQPQRSSQQDLKVSGDLQGASSSSEGFIPYNELRTLPQVTFTVSHDSNFHGKAKLTGVYLDELLKVLGFGNSRQIVSAAGNDDYEAHYTEEYRAAHRPILILRINGHGPEAWPANGDNGGGFGPYVISHEKFKPAWHILAHKDEAQIPYGVVELKFSNEDEVLRALDLPGNHAADSPEMQGEKIAFQNCLRCHNLDAWGGHKAGSTWNTLAADAARDPRAFAQTIRDPRASNQTASMPGNPEYDRKTLHALTAYFQAFGHKDGQ